MRSILKMPSDDVAGLRSRRADTLDMRRKAMRSILKMPSDDVAGLRSRRADTLE